MEQILNEFGVKPLLLAAQVVNFLVLLWILKKLLYKPLIKVLDERKQKIAQSLKNAEEIEKRLVAETQKKEKRILAAAKERKKIIKQAEGLAIQLIEEGKSKAESLAGQVLDEARNLAQVEREKMRQEMREHMATFVMLALEKVTGKVITKEDQKKMIEDTVKRM